MSEDRVYTSVLEPYGKACFPLKGGDWIHWSTIHGNPVELHIDNPYKHVPLYIWFE